MDFLDLYNLAQEIITSRSDAGKASAIVPVADLKAALIKGVDWLDDINFHPVETKPGDPLGHYECFSDTDSRWDEPNSWVVVITYNSELNSELWGLAKSVMLHTAPARPHPSRRGWRTDDEAMV